MVVGELFADVFAISCRATPWGQRRSCSWQPYAGIQLLTWSDCVQALRYMQTFAVCTSVNYELGVDIMQFFCLEQAIKVYHEG